MFISEEGLVGEEEKMERFPLRGTNNKKKRTKRKRKQDEGRGKSAQRVSPKVKKT